MDNQQKNKALFETVPVPEAIGQMIVPAIFSQIIVLIYNLADTFYIGRTNSPEMVAAASLVLPVFNTLIAIAAIAGFGGSSVVSRLLGVSRRDEARRVFSFGTRVSAAITVLFSLVMLAFSEPILLLLGAKAGKTLAYAQDYTLWVIILGGVPTVLSNVLSNFVRSVGESGKAGAGITLGGIVNIVLDPLFMFILLPRGNEIIGAGVATCISNCISCVYFLVVLRKLGKDSVLHLCPIRQLPEKSSIRSTFAVGLPSAVSMFLFDLDFIVIDRLMSGYSTVALAAVGIVLKAERLPLNIGVGICQGMVPIIAYNFASGDHKRMRALSRYALMVGIICALISIALYEAFAPFIMRLFIRNGATVSLGTRFLRARCVATVLMFMSFYHANLFNAYGRGKESMFLGVMRWAVFNIPMLFLFNRLFGMYGIVWAQCAGDVLTVLLSLWLHARFWHKEGRNIPLAIEPRAW